MGSVLRVVPSFTQANSMEAGHASTNTDEVHCVHYSHLDEEKSAPTPRALGQLQKDQHTRDSMVSSWSPRPQQTAQLRRQALLKKRQTFGKAPHLRSTAEILLTPRSSTEQPTSPLDGQSP